MSRSQRLLRTANRLREQADNLNAKAREAETAAYEAALADGEDMGNRYLGEHADMRGAFPKSKETY